MAKKFCRESNTDDFYSLGSSQQRTSWLPHPSFASRATDRGRLAQTFLWEDLMATRKSSGSRKKSSGRKYGKAAGKTVASAMRRKKKGTLRSGKGGKGGAVKSRKQAIAIGLSEARKKGAKVPKKTKS